MSCLSLFSISILSYGLPGAAQGPSGLQSTCDQIAAAISGASQVFFPASPKYSSDIYHASNLSSQVSACSVEPGSAEDVSKILRILGPSRTPFAVKGGGHATNPGFSSSRGVQISMIRFNGTKVDSTSGTVEVGAGLTWGQVYDALDPTGVNVVGGRVPDVGVAGLTLGGGYSFKSSQYGLAVDNVVGYELVLPNGAVICVTSKDEDLWFGLRGGSNNFGIVTKFILESHPQSEVWGGIRIYAENQLDAIKDALVTFQQKSDTKAALLPTMSYTSGQLAVLMIYFYDAPTPSEVFEDFLAIPAVAEDVSTRSFTDLVHILGPQVLADDVRVFYDCAPVTNYSPAVFDVFVNQTKFWGAQYPNVTLTVALEPFDSGLFTHGSGSAYPPDRSHVILPSNIGFEWSDPSLDTIMAPTLRSISSAIRAVALADGQNVSQAAKYPNYAIFGTPLEDIYGGNVERLQDIREAIDPEDVMGLAGGWKF
ncbi:FAD dependent oxidoreductase [Russula aff. rugulosa BPL654]|nr:FAD dependent oxidoreductase [Russula aff. rugulosa BPL654]